MTGKTPVPASPDPLDETHRPAVIRGQAAPEASGSRLSRRRMLRVGLRALGVAALVGGPYSAWSTRCDTTRHVVRLGVPRPIRVAGISDLHLDQDRAKYERLVDAVNAERPDVLVVVGDTIDCRKGRAPEDLVPLIRSIEAPLG